MEQPKTECPMCGNIWQEHTISEIDGCEAILELQISQAYARSAALRGEASVLQPQVSICPVCSKRSDEHTDADLVSCLGNWRKREQGATGLELQGRFLEAQLENEDPDPVERTQIRAKTLQLLCSCGKAVGDHTRDEIRFCAERTREERRTA